MDDEKVSAQYLTQTITLDQYLDSNIFVAYISNSTGVDKWRIVLFKRDSVIKVFPNHQFWKRKVWGGFSSFSGPSFFRLNGELSIKEVYNDTIFQITKTSLIPRFVIQTEGHNPYPELQDKKIDADFFKEIANYMLFSHLCENKNCIFFQLQFNNIYFYTGFFDKSSKKTTICNLQDPTKSAFIDDLNGFLPISPIGITEANEMISILEAQDIIRWIKENPDKAKTIGGKMKWMKTYSESSNPIVVIAKLKE